MIGKSVLECVENGFVSVIRMLRIVANHQLTAISEPVGVVASTRWRFMVQQNHRPIVVQNWRVVVVGHINDLVSVIRDGLVVADLRSQSVPMAIGFNGPHQSLGGERRQNRCAEPATAKLKHRTIGMFEASQEDRNMGRKWIHDFFPQPPGLIRSTAFCQVCDISVPCITCDFAMW